MTASASIKNDSSFLRLQSKSLNSFKLILPIEKGGYGSVALYKKISTSIICYGKDHGNE